VRGTILLDYSELTGRIIGCAMKVHSVLRPGLLESAYRVRLIHELSLNGLENKAELPLPVVYEGVRLDSGYQLDILVENSVVVEVKAVEEVAPIHKAQAITYLKLGGFPVGLLINFNVVHLRDVVERFINRFKHCRRVVTHYDKLAATFLGFVQLASIVTLPLNVHTT
jgi:GxxExxY protein